MTGTDRMVLRNIDARPSGSVRPSDVPRHLDGAALEAILRAGRPDADPAAAAARAGSITVRGIRCPTMTAGEGRPVLCVHGLGHDAWDFTPFFVRCNNTALALTALDLPGFGLADKPMDARYTMDLHVDALLAAAAQASLQAKGPAPAVVASSLGGHIALLAALKDPKAFSRLVLVAPGGLVDAPSAMQAMARAYYSVDAICSRGEDEIVGNSRRIFAKAGSDVDDALAARKLAVHRSDKRREFAVPFAGVVDDVFNHVVMSRVPEVHVPTLILSGERDVVVPTDVCATAARRMSARFTSFKEVGHCPHLEAPDAFADAVLPFLHGDA